MRSQRDDSHTDEPKMRDPITPKSELVVSSSRYARSPGQETTSPPSTPKQCAQSSEDDALKVPVQNKCRASEVKIVNNAMPSGTGIAPPQSIPKQCTQSRKNDSPRTEATRTPSRVNDDDFLDNFLNDGFRDGSLEDETREGIQPHKEDRDTRIRRILEKARPDETMAFMIGATTRGFPRDQDIEDVLREQFAFLLDCHEHQVSIGRPSVDEILYEIEVSAQGDKDIKEEHRKWSWMLTYWVNFCSLQTYLSRRNIYITEIYLQNDTWSEGWR